ncbi:CHAT domain-containing protein [Streptosporangiaceae bacterium NEAU-GS5]|nr:CHAT domain-containing protein [Streptosporangiaceae bacterium NEAU-GS5]
MNNDPIRQLSNQQMMHALQQSSQYLSTQDRAHLDEAIRAVEAAIDLMQRLGPPELIDCLRMAEQLLFGRWLLDHRDADLDTILGRCARIDAAPSAGPAEDASHETVIAHVYETRFNERGDRADLDEAIRRWQLATDTSSADDPGLEMRRASLARAERARQAMADERLQEALDLELPGDDEDELSLRIRAVGFLMRYRMGGPRADADRAVVLLERAKSVARDAGDVAAAEKLLGDIAMLRFDRHKTAVDLDDAIQHYTAAFDGMPSDAERANEEDIKQFTEDLARLVNAHTVRAMSTGDRTHSDEALQVMKHHVGDRRLTSVNRGQLWTSMTTILEGRVRATRQREDLTAAVATARKAVEATAGTPAEPRALSHLATCLGLEYELFGEAAHLLDAASVATRAAEAAVESDPVRTLRLLNAANLWFLLGERERDAGQIDKALAQLASPAHTPGEHQATAMLRTQMCWRTRYDITGRPADLDAAVAAGLDLWNSPLRHSPHGQPGAMQLCEALTTRGLLTSTTEDLDRALQIGSMVLNSLPQGHPNLPLMLFHLRAEPARHRFTLSGERSDLDGAIEAAHAALQIAVGDDDVITIIVALGDMLRIRFAETRDEADLRSAAGYYRALVERLPPPHPTAWPTLVDLATTLRQAFLAGGATANAEEAIARAREVTTSPDADPAIVIRAWIVLCETTTDLALAAPDTANMGEAVRTAEDAVAAASGHLLLPRARLALARARYAHYTYEGGEALFALTTEILEVIAEQSTDDEERAYGYAQLGRLHSARHDEQRSPNDLERAIEFFDRAVNTAGHDSNAMVAYTRELYSLRARRAEATPTAAATPAAQRAAEAEALLTRFITDHDPAMLQAAITAWFVAASIDPDRYGPGLAAALSFADSNTQEQGALLTLYYHLATAPADPDRAEQAVMFVMLLYRRWRETLRPEMAQALRDAIATLRQASDIGRDFPLAAGELLHDLFTLTGDEPTLHDAITALEDFVAAATNDPRRDEVVKRLAFARHQVGDPLNQTRSAADLANAWWELEPTVERARDLLAATERAAAEVPSGHPEQPNLVCNVANALIQVATLTRDPTIATQAVTAARTAVAAVQDARILDETLRDKAAIFLGSALLLDLRSTYDEGRAAEAAGLAMELLDHPQHSFQARVVLAEILLLGQPEDPVQANPAVLHQVVRYTREAIELLPETDRNLQAARILLIQALFRRFLTTRDTADLTEVLQLTEDATDHGLHGISRLLAGLPDDERERPEAAALLATMDPEAAASLAEQAADLAMIVAEDDHAEWLLSLRAHLATAQMPYGGQRFLVAIARQVHENRPSLALRLLRRVVDELGTADDEDGRRGAAEAWSMIGMLTEGLSQWDEAFIAYERAMELYRHLDEPLSEVYRLRDMALVCSGRKDNAAGAAYFDRAIQRAREADLTEVEPDLLMLSLSTVDPAIKVARAEQAGDRFLELGQRDKAATAHGVLAFLAVDRDDAAEAVRQVEVAANLAESGDVVERTYQHVWQVMVGKGLSEQAHALEEGLAARTRPAAPRQTADHFYNFALQRISTGDTAGAMISFRAARAEYLAQGNRDGVASVDVRIGTLHVETNEVDEAIATFRSAGAEFAEISSWMKASHAYLNAAACRRGRADTPDDADLDSKIAERLRGAATDLARAADYANRSGDRTALFSIRLEQGRLEAEQRQYAVAADHLAEAEHLAAGRARLLGMLEETRARVAQLSSDTAAEREALERAIDHFRRADRPRAAAGVAVRLSALLQESGDLRQARSLVQYAIDNIEAAEPQSDSERVFVRVISRSGSMRQALYGRAAMLDVQLGRLDEAWENLARSGPGRDVVRERFLSAIMAIRQALAANDLRTALEIGQRTLDETDDPELQSLLLFDLSAHARELGELQLAYDYAARGLTLAEDLGARDLGRHLWMLGSASRRLGRVAEAVTHLRRAAYLVAQSDPDEQGAAGILNSFALALIDHGDWDEADRVLAGALESARASGQRRTEASLLSTRAGLSLRRGDLNAASTGYRDAIRIQEDLRDTTALAGAYANLGLVHLSQGDVAEARALTELALNAERRSGRRTDVVLDLVALANLEEPDVAVERLQEALTTSREIGYDYGIGLALAGLGAVELQRNDPAAARDRFTEAIEIFKRIGDISGLADAYLNRSSAHELLGDLPAAVRDAEESDRLWRLLDAGQESLSVNARIASERLIALCTNAGRGVDAWQYVERDKARDLLDRLNTGDWPMPPNAPSELLDREGELLRELRALQTDIVNAREPARRGGAVRRLTPIRAALEAVWDRLTASAPDYVAVRRATAPTRDDLDRIVADGQVGLLGFHLGESETAVLTYRSGQEEPAARLTWALPVDMLESMRRANGAEMPMVMQWPDGRRDLVDGGQFIGVTLLYEGVQALGDDLDQLYLLPHGGLNRLPLHILPGPDGGPLLDRVPVAYAPSAGVLARLRARPRPAGQRLSRVLGYAPSEPEDARGLIEATAADTAAALGTEVQCGARVTRDLLPGSWNVLHLSCHGEFDEQDPFGSGVRLADGLLTAREIMGMRIDANLVVLAACETGQSGAQGGVDIAGLGYALLHAGTRCALLTLWPVDAGITRTLMSLFYTNLVPGKSTAAALREAVLELRRIPEHEDPAVWGAYVLIGDAS